MIGKNAERVINQAVQYAMSRSHEYLTIEHLLLSLLDEEAVAETVQAQGASLDKIKEEIENFLDKEVPKINARGDRPETEGVEQPLATAAVQRLIQRALFQVQSSQRNEIKPIDLFAALFNSKESQALYILGQNGLNRLDVLKYISHELQNPTTNDTDEDGETAIPNGENKKGKISRDALDEYGENLNQKAKQNRIDPIVGRELEIERMIQTLCRRRKNNPLLVGEAGVGKTALAEGLALRITEGKIPDLLQNAVVYSLDLGLLLAGAKFRGDFEQRLKKVLDGLKRRSERGELPLLFIDEIHTLIGAGSVSGSSMDAANLLKPMLAQGELRCIGSTTYAEYRNIFEKDHALTRRFQKIDVIEPTIEEAVQILRGLKPKFETYHGVTYEDEALRAAVDLSSKHINDRFLPDKAIDVIDEAGARSRLKGGPKIIDTIFIEEMIAQIARLPAKAVTVHQKDRLKNLDRDLRLTIFGQDHAVDNLTSAIRLARSGLRGGDKPMGSFLMCGPTGVGKTELSKQLAFLLGVPFIRFDMSEYSERHTVSRLIGAPPGYVGFDQQGLLTGEVLKHPHSVVLLDEIEKAHPEVWNILLQVMDHGTLTDNNGRKVDFRNTVILMTSNVGSRELERRGLGISGELMIDGRAASKAVDNTFSPEFRNRLDAILFFNPLDPVTIGHVVGKQLVELEELLLAKHVDIEFDADVREWLAVNGYDKKLGARPMQRLIQNELKKPLAESLLFGELQSGGNVRVTLRDGKVHMEIKKAEAPVPDESEAGVKNPV